MATPHVKCVAVGDGAVGKTCLLLSYAKNEFPDDYVPTVFDNYACSVTVDGQVAKLELWDTAGQEEYDRMRPLSYPNTDVFLVVFSIVDRDSFNNVRNKWIPELQSQPMVNLDCSKIVLCGTKMDLREDAAFASTDKVSFEEGESLAAEVGAQKYCECSALRRTGLKETFDDLLRVTLELGQWAPAGETKSAADKAAQAAALAQQKFGRFKTLAAQKLEQLSQETENELANPESEMRQTMAVVKKGVLEKKGGNTVLLPDGTIKKERNLKKGGRRNWTKKYFVLLDNGVLLYYKDEVQSAKSYDGCLQLGAESVIQILETEKRTDFVVSTGCESDAADSSKPSLLLRADGTRGRDQWIDFIESFIARVGGSGEAQVASGSEVEESAETSLTPEPEAEPTPQGQQHAGAANTPSVAAGDIEEDFEF